jgi:hypothetical protein
MSSSSLNTDNDGFLDTLRLAGNASVTTAGEYQIAGTLYAPNGKGGEQESGATQRPSDTRSDKG